MDVLTLFDSEDINRKYNNTKKVLLSVINEIILYKQSLTKADLDIMVYSLLIICSAYSLYVSYNSRTSYLEKERCNREVRALLVLEAARYAEEKLVEESKEKYTDIIEPRIDFMESRVYNMSQDLELLKVLCPQMSDRKVSFGSLPGATWHTGSMYHADVIIIDYNIVDILTSNILDVKQAQYTYLTIKGLLSENSDILIMGGAKLIVKKAVRLSRGMRDISSGTDLTSDAKATLETAVVRLPR